MNKQEVIEEINNLKGLTILDETINFDDEMVSKKEVLNIVKQLDEPEKPVLTKEEAEWVDKLNESFNLPDALYYITRLGYGHLFNFEMCGKTYELPFDSHATYGEMRKLKERLVNAVLYGYEIEKEKLYTVEIPNPNGDGYRRVYLGRNEYNKIKLHVWDCFPSIEFSNDWKQLDIAQLTEAEIKKDFEWAFRWAEEVEE